MLGDEEKEGYVDWGDAVRDPDGLGGESEDDDDNDDVDTVDEETSGNALCALDCNKAAEQDGNA